MQPTSVWRFALFPVILSWLGSTVSAADLGARHYSPLVRLETFDWSGLHIGITGGGAFDGHDPGFSFENVPPDSVALLPHGADLTSKGGLVGGEIGYDIVTGGWLLGVEGDISWTNFGDRDTHRVDENTAIGLPPITFATNYQMDWISTVRGRIGIPFDHFLVYGTGGLAFADVSMNTTVTVGDPPIGQLVGSTEKTKAGWTLGGGAEYALCNNITIKTEAMWFDLGSISLNAAAPALTNSSLDVDQKIEGVIARAGIGYKF
jgi:outer membrane immunogenic protein